MMTIILKINPYENISSDIVEQFVIKDKGDSHN